jgi:hypothetical protein
MADQHESPRNKATTASHDDVARRAYELFQARGSEAGHDLEHLQLGRLTITPAEATTVYTPEQAAALDFGLTASVKLRLLFDRDVSGWQINVDTRDRVVTLKGVADTGGEKTRVVRIARERMVWPVSSIS